MRAQRLINVAEGELALQTAELGDPGPGELVVRTRVSGISPGTERAWCLGLPNTARDWPRPTGYSLVGEVVAAGDGVDIEIGARVHAPEPHASAVRITTDALTPVPDGVRDDHAAFLTLLQIALGGVRKARIELGESALVIGGGLIGQLAAQFAHTAGAGRVLLADISEYRRRMADECGLAEPVDPSSEAGRTAIAQAGERGGPEVVIEATGAPGPICDAFVFAGRRGRVVLLGSTRGQTDGVDFYRDVHKKGLTIIGAHNAIRPGRDDRPGAWTAARDNRAGLRLMETGRLNLDPLITHRFPAAEFKAAYDLLFGWDERMLGCVLDWSGNAG